MTFSGSLTLDMEITVLWGVICFLWKSKKALFVRICPRPFEGIPIPLPSKAVMRTSSLMSDTSTSVGKLSCVAFEVLRRDSSPAERGRVISWPWCRYPPRKRNTWGKCFPRRSWNRRLTQSGSGISCITDGLLIFDTVAELWLDVHQVLEVEQAAWVLPALELRAHFQ